MVDTKDRPSINATGGVIHGRCNPGATLNIQPLNLWSTSRFVLGERGHTAASAWSGVIAKVYLGKALSVHF